MTTDSIEKRGLTQSLEADPASTGQVSLARLRSIVTRLHRLLRQGHQLLTPAQETLLAQLNRSGPQTVGQLAEDQGISSATVSRMLATLERKELVLRARDKRDRRVVYVIATREGAAQSARELREPHQANLLSDLSAADGQTINQALDLLDLAADQAKYKARQ